MGKKQRTKSLVSPEAFDSQKIKNVANITCSKANPKTSQKLVG